jgi:hypothetical protein
MLPYLFNFRHASEHNVRHNNNNSVNSILYFNVPTQQLQEPVTESDDARYNRPMSYIRLFIAVTIRKDVKIKFVKLIIVFSIFFLVIGLKISILVFTTINIQTILKCIHKATKYSLYVDNGNYFCITFLVRWDWV